MNSYLSLVKKVLKTGVWTENRTGIKTQTLVGHMFEHDMNDGFPLLTTKKVPLRLISSELEFFIKGITDKQWLIDRNNHIRDERCSPDCIPYAHDAQTKEKMKNERELGPIYGFQWRNFGGEYTDYKQENPKTGTDQLQKLIHTLKNNPQDRRMIVSAWNPQELSRQALPPCHYGFQITVTENKLNLLWNQRSVDVGLGLPFNIASYALLLHLLAKESGFQEGKLIGFLANTHIYENHIETLKKQLMRTPSELAQIQTENFSTIFDRKYTDTIVKNYKPQSRLPMPVAV